MSEVPATPELPQCKYINLTPYSWFGAWVGEGGPHRYTMTVAMKASFAMSPEGGLKVLEEQLTIRGDEFAGDDQAAMNGELLHGCDLSGWKPRADLLLLGSAYAPGGRPATACEVAFRVGRWEKRLLVTGDRIWKPGVMLSRAGEPQPFTRLPLRWERAFGGEGCDTNPVGRGRKSDLLPNLEYIDDRLNRRGGRVRPASFGPVNRLWQPRMRKMGTCDKSYLERLHPRYPDDFDWGYFNEASDDQQLEGYLRGDEEVGFRNLHPEVPEWSLRLPGSRVRCFVEGTDDAGVARVREIAMNLDTLVAYVDDGHLSLIWRGYTEVRTEDRSEITRMLFAEESLTEPRDSTWYLAQVAEGKDLFESKAAEVEAQADAVMAEVQAKLDRYGLKVDVRAEVVAVRNGAAGVPAAMMTCFPFDPMGPFPPQLKHMEADLEEAAREVAEVDAKAKAKLEELGYDYGEVVAAVNGGEAAPLAQAHASLKERKQYLEDMDREVPDQMQDLLDRFDRNPDDPFEIHQIFTGLRDGGIDLAKVGAAEAEFAASGNFAAYLAAKMPGCVVEPPADGCKPMRELIEKRNEERKQEVEQAGQKPSAEGAGSPDITGAVDEQGQSSPPTDVAAADGAAGAESAAGAADDSRGSAEAAGETGAPGGGGGEASFERASAGAPAARSGNPLLALMAAIAAVGGGKLATPVLGGIDAVAAQGMIDRGETFAGQVLSNSDFSGVDLAGQNFTGAMLNGAAFGDTPLAGARFENALMRDCVFDGADCREVAFVGCDLGGSSFRGADLRGASFSNCGCVDVIFANAIMRGATLESTAFSDCDFCEADLRETTCKNFILQNCDLRGIVAAGCTWDFLGFYESRLADADLRDTHLVNCVFKSCIAPRLNCGRAELEGFRTIGESEFDEAVFSEARLGGSTFMYARLLRADFSYGDLRGACFIDNVAWECRFRHADCKGAMLRRSQLVKADFTGANLCQAVLGAADVRAAVFTGSNCFECDFTGALTTDAQFSGANLRGTLVQA